MDNTRQRTAAGTFLPRFPQRVCERCGKPTKAHKNRFCSRSCFLLSEKPGPKQAPFWDSVEVGPTDKCWPWRRGTTRAGYGQTWLNGKNVLAHRVAWEIHNGSVPKGVIRHSCDNPRCCNPFHLSDGTYKDNTADMLSRNRNKPPQGEKNRHAKLTSELVISMRAEDARGASRTYLAEKYSVTTSTVSSIINRITWKHV